MPVAGGGGDAAMTALRARAFRKCANSGSTERSIYPNGMKRECLQTSHLLQKQMAGKKVCQLILLYAKREGSWCAAPVNVHRIDWIWANADVLGKNGISMPATWDEFNAAAEKLAAAGITPLAHGGQAWQDATVFERWP